MGWDASGAITSSPLELVKANHSPGPPFVAPTHAVLAPTQLRLRPTYLLPTGRNSTGGVTGTASLTSCATYTWHLVACELYFSGFR